MFGGPAALAMVLALPAAASAAKLSLSPGVPARGAQVTIAASGFAPGSRGVARLAGARSAGFRADTRGRATIRLQLRRSARLGSHRLVVRAGRRHVSTVVTVVARRREPSRLAALTNGRRVLLTPARGRSGAPLRLRVSGHPRRALITVRLAGSALARERASARGTLALRATTPAVRAGRHQVTVRAGRGTIGLPYDVLAAPAPQPGPLTPPPVPPSGGSAVLVGAGDIAGCNNPGDEATAALLDQIPGTVFTLGDNVYPTGTLSQFNSCYATSWGRHKARTRPALGNHEYDSSGSTGHFDYFGAAAGPAGKGYYSYDVGSWHVVVLNSNCAFVGGCHAGSPQEQWLRTDLAASRADCTVAMMHHPRFSSGSTHGNNTAMAPFWQALYDAGAELMLAGHDHAYERFAPMTASGVLDSSFGLRSFLIGTGGFSHYTLGTPVTGSQARNSDTFGVVKFTLHDGAYDWQFVPEAGKTYSDAGSGTCHGRPAQTATRTFARASSAGAGSMASAGVAASASARRRPAALSVLPGVPARGSQVTVQASGFRPRSSGIARLAGARSKRFRTNARGSATIKLNLRRAIRTGTRRLSVRTGSRRVKTTLTVVARRGVPSRLAALAGGRRVLLQPTRGRPGERLSLRISGHPRRAMLDVRLGSATLARRRASSRGALTLRAAAPALPAGTQRVTVAARGGTITLPFRLLPAPAPPPPPPAPQPAPDPVVAAAGDIACSASDPAFAGGTGTSTACRQRATSDLLVNAGLSSVLALGDVQYDCARLADFQTSFDLSWGRVKSLIRPTPGNHEYIASNPDAYGNSGCTAGAQGYFSYFGAVAGDPARGYYSFDLGAWHIVSLNSNNADDSSCPIVSCAAGSEQEQWLRADLAAHPASCTLAFWHHPLFTSKTRTNAVRPLWDALYAAGADVILNGHVHNYERFAPQRPDGGTDPVGGIRQFVVGTGGKSVEDLGVPAPNSQQRGNAYGVLELTLRAGSYDWRFKPVAGSTFTDAGSTACH